MSGPSNTFNCPRCGERLPAGFTRCDACGAFIVAAHEGDAPAVVASSAAGVGGGAGGRAATRKASGSAGSNAWAFLIVGLVIGGAVGYALRTAVTPREEGGMPRGPADVMAGASQGAAPDAGSGPGGAGDATAGLDKTQMMPQVVEALAKYRNALEDDPTNVEANIGMGNMMFDAGKWEKAIEHYTAALAKDPMNGDVRVDRAIAYHSIGKNDEALTDLKRVTRENPKHVNAWLNLGVVAGAMGDTKTNVAAWEKYLSLEPSGQHADAIRSELAKLKG